MKGKAQKSQFQGLLRFTRNDIPAALVEYSLVIAYCSLTIAH